MLYSANFTGLRKAGSVHSPTDVLLYLSRLIATLIVFALMIEPTGATEASRAARALHAARSSIQLAELREHAETLADDVMEGREAGHRGGRAAAQPMP